MRIGIIGAGSVGTALGAGWAKAGHQVVYGERSHKEPPHPGATTDSVRGAAGASEVILLATPWSACRDALAAAGDLNGKTLLDATNPIAPGYALALGHTTSGAEQVAALSGARVVKAFNTTGVDNMVNPRYGEARALMPLASDDLRSLELAAKLAADLGFEAVQLPSLARARELEPLAMLWIKLAMQWGHGRNIAFGITRRGAGAQLPELPRMKHRRAITVVGSGSIGKPLARAWLRAGHDVHIATRNASAGDVQELLAAGATAGPVDRAAADAEVVVLAIPAGAVVETCRAMGGLEGKIVVDCSNAIGKGFTLVHGFDTSSAEQVAAALPGAKVVRAFNQQGAEMLENPRFRDRIATNFIAGDDAGARALVRELSSDAGLDSIEAGPLDSARYLEPMTLLWVAISRAIGTREFGLSLLRR